LVYIVLTFRYMLLYLFTKIKQKIWEIYFLAVIFEVWFFVLKTLYKIRFKPRPKFQICLKIDFAYMFGLLIAISSEDKYEAVKKK